VARNDEIRAMLTSKRRRGSTRFGRPNEMAIGSSASRCCLQGEICFASRSVRSREAVPAFIFHWQRGCYGWRV